MKGRRNRLFIHGTGLIMASSWYGRRRSFLLTNTSASTSLLFPNKVLDEIHVLFDDFLCNPRTFEATEERSPRRIDVGRCKSLL